MLDLIKQSGYSASLNNLDQHYFFSKTDVNYKTMTQFEPSPIFALPGAKQAPVTRIGEHESYVSDIEIDGHDSSDESGPETPDSTIHKSEKLQKLAEQEFD